MYIVGKPRPHHIFSGKKHCVSRFSQLETPIVPSCLLQPQLPLQVAFAFQLPGEIGGEFRGDATIPRGIPAAIDTSDHQGFVET